MKMFTRFTSLALASLLALAPLSITPAVAQVPSISVVAPALRTTFSAVATGLTPAASATDFFTLSGSATKVVRVTRIECNGSATATTGLPVDLLKRSTADSGGTATTPTATPHDSSNAAATASPKAYTGNPTTGTLAGLVRSAPLVLATLTTPAIGNGKAWDFGNQFITDQALTLRGTGDVLALNARGASLPSGTLMNCQVEWNEQ